MEDVRHGDEEGAGCLMEEGGEGPREGGVVRVKEEGQIRKD